MSAAKDNKYALGCTTSGQPPIFKEPKELEDKCREYLEYCIKNDEKPTITGLTLFVGFCSRSSWDDYAKKKEYSYIVKRAKMTIENSYEKGGGTFDIFALKNMGWSDKSEVTNRNYNVNSKELTKKEMQEYQETLENDF